MAVENELHKRKKLDHVNTIEDVVELINNSEKIIVLAGAGKGVIYMAHARNQHELRYPGLPFRYRRLLYAS